MGSSELTKPHYHRDGQTRSDCRLCTPAATEPQPKPGDLIELRKGDEFFGGIVEIVEQAPPEYQLAVFSRNAKYSIISLIEDGYTLTIKERAPEPLPTVPGLYGARDDWAGWKFPTLAFRKDERLGWATPTAEPLACYQAVKHAHEARGGLVRLVPEDAPRFSDEELDVLREVLDCARSDSRSLQGCIPLGPDEYKADRARIEQARRILGLVPAEGSAVCAKCRNEWDYRGEPVTTPTPTPNGDTK